MNAIFFDMDGTIIDSRADLANAVNATRAALSLSPLPQDEILLNVGCGARYLLEKSIPEMAGHFDEVTACYTEQYHAHLIDKTELYPSVRKTIDTLASRGWLLGINTNKPRSAVDTILDHFGLTRYFGNAIIAGGDCDEMKPSPKPLRQVANLMRGHRLSAHDWMIGDNWTDLECGNNAGVKTAFCRYGFGHAKDARYTISINRLEELLRYCSAEE